MTKKNKSRNFWKKVRSKYKLSFFNENTLEEVWTFRLSQLGAFLFFTALIAVICFATAFIIAGTPLKTLLPGYMKTETRLQMVNNALRIDSLSEAIKKTDQYYANLEKILKGEVTTKLLQANNDSAKGLPVDSLLEKSEATEAFITKYEKEEKYNLTVFNTSIPTEGLIFYTPVSGIIDKKFDPASGKYGVTLLPAANSSISSILDGTVVQASFSPNDGYTIAIQHTNNFISIYRNASSLLKQMGDRVAGGEKIALVGDQEKQSKSLFVIELWHKGQPLDPTSYISF